MKEESNFLGYKDAQIVGYLYSKDDTIHKSSENLNTLPETWSLAFINFMKRLYVK